MDVCRMGYDVRRPFGAGDVCRVVCGRPPTTRRRGQNCVRAPPRLGHAHCSGSSFFLENPWARFIIKLRLFFRFLNHPRLFFFPFTSLLPQGPVSLLFVYPRNCTTAAPPLYRCRFFLGWHAAVWLHPASLRVLELPRDDALSCAF